ncbi:MAG: hypothetical protein NUV76_08275, partial [Candidatus Kuenenia sp.]|nr:hypothetical protein [Candidatus Kuenenia sp.]
VRYSILDSFLSDGKQGKNIKNNLALMGLHPLLYTDSLSGLTLSSATNLVALQVILSHIGAINRGNSGGFATGTNGLSFLYAWAC